VSLSWLSAKNSCLPSYKPFIDRAFGLKAFHGSSFGICSKMGFNFFFPFTCSHLYLLMTRFPWLHCSQHARLLKVNPCRTKNIAAKKKDSIQGKMYYMFPSNCHPFLLWHASQV